MPDTIIENPILNSPFREPDRHWRFTDEGITNEIVETRRASAYFVPIPPPKKKGKQRVQGIVGAIRVDTLDDLKNLRLNEVAFRLAKLTLENYFRDDGGHSKPWLFPQLLAITKRWLAESMTCKGRTFPQLLMFVRFAHEAADRIYRSIVASVEGSPTLKPILRPYDTVGTTRYVDFHTIRETYKTRADKCHVSHVAGDSGGSSSWLTTSRT